MKKQVIMGVALLALGSAVTQASAEEQAVEMGGVGVTGKKDKQPVYSATTMPSSASATVEEFTKEDIQSIAPASVYDIAALSPGARVEFQGRKGMNALQLRGGDTVGIILDGVYIPWSQASRIMAQFPVDAIESVRIVRDSSAVTLGPFVAFSPAMSHDNVPSPGLGSSNQGFMVITTKKGKGPELGGIAEYGSLDTRNFQLYHGNSKGPFSYRMVGTASGTSGREGWNNAANNLSLLLNGNYDSKALKADFLVYYANGRREIQRSTKDSTAYTSLWNYDPLESLQIALNLHKPWNAVHTTSLSYARGRVTDDEYLKSSTSTTIPQAVRQEDQVETWHLWHVAATENNRLTGGFQAFLWKSPTGQFFYEGVPRKEDLFSGYLQDEYKFNNRLTLDGGVRVDTKLIEQGSDKYSPLQATNKKIENEWQQPAISMSIGSSYQLNEQHKLLARMGYTRQEADTFLATVGNKTLNTEERFKYEAGVEASYHPAFNPSVTLFLYDINNFAYSAATGGSGSSVYNIYDTANIIRKGVETSVKGSLPWGFGYHAGYSYITTNRGDTNKVMPHHNVSLRLSHQIGGLESNLILNYVGPYENNFLSVGNIYRPAGEYTRVDLNISYGFKLDKAQLRATVYGRNLLDDRYVTIAGWQDQGITCGAKLEVAF